MSNNALLLQGRDDHAPLFALSRGSALVHLKGRRAAAVPFSRRSRPCIPQRRLRRLKLGTPTARRPYQFFTKGAGAPRRGSTRLKLKT